VLGGRPSGQPAARKLRGNIAPEERAKNKPLGFLIPVKSIIFLKTICTLSTGKHYSYSS